MARKALKKTISKGERLGWTPLDQVHSVSLSSVIVKGRLVTPATSVKSSLQQNQTSFLIP